MSPCTAPNLDVVAGLIRTDAGVRRDFLDFYDVSSRQGTQMDTRNWEAYWCGIAALTEKEFKVCPRRSFLTGIPDDWRPEAASF